MYVFISQKLWFTDEPFVQDNICYFINGSRTLNQKRLHYLEARSRKTSLYLVRILKLCICYCLWWKSKRAKRQSCESPLNMINLELPDNYQWLHFWIALIVPTNSKYSSLSEFRPLSVSYLCVLTSIGDQTN